MCGVETLDGRLIKNPCQVVLGPWFSRTCGLPRRWYMAVKGHWLMHRWGLHLLRIMSPQGRPQDDPQQVLLASCLQQCSQRRLAGEPMSSFLRVLSSKWQQPHLVTGLSRVSRTALSAVLTDLIFPAPLRNILIPRLRMRTPRSGRVTCPRSKNRLRKIWLPSPHSGCFGLFFKDLFIYF